MHIFITGASGFIGQHVMKTCLQAGHSVTACVRNTNWLNTYFPQANAVQVDFTQDHDVEAWLPRLNNIDVAINCVGIIREQGQQTFANLHTKAATALFKACEQAKVRKVIQVSALGADETAFSEYHLSKKAADDCLSQLDVEWTILMPSIVYGHGAKSMTFFKALAALPVTPLVDKGDQPIQPVHIDDLCRTVLLAIESDRLSRKRLDIVGPSPITMRAMYSILKTWLGLRTSLFLPIPYQWSLVAARLGGFLGNTPITREAVQMLKQGNTGNVADFREVTGITPCSFEQTILSSPPLPSESVFARQFFITPLLRISLALLWIVTGYISDFVYPEEMSFNMLATLGIGNTLAPFALYGAAALDFILGAALFFNYKARPVLLIQIALMLSYSILITLGMPELWAHPFGPVTKNIPLIMATLLLLSTVRE